MQKFAKPKDGVMIRRPDSNDYLLNEGENVPYDTFWRRREAEGDIVFSDAVIPPDAVQSGAPAAPKLQAVPDAAPAMDTATVADKGGSK